MSLLIREWVQRIASLLPAGSLKRDVKRVERFSRWAAAAQLMMTTDPLKLHCGGHTQRRRAGGYLRIKVSLLDVSSGHAAGTEAVLLCRYGLDQLLHPADLRGHLLSQDLVAVLQAPKLALEHVGGVHGEPGVLLALLALGLSALQLLADVAQVAGDALVLLLVPTLLLLVYGQQRRHVLPARALVALQIPQAFLCCRNLLEDLGEALKVDVGVVGWHAGVRLDGVLLQTSGLQASALSLVVSLLLADISPLNHLEREKCKSLK